MFMAQLLEISNQLVFDINDK